MAAIHDLLKQVQDPALRARLESEINNLTKNKKFGLVFEEHIPECTPLYDVPVKSGATVARNMPGKIDEVYRVLKISDGIAVCCKKTDNTLEEIPVDELIAVAQFGDPIYPYLKPVDSVCNAPDSDLWHTLIEADNYHALQLLQYLYAGKVDCIYIDPPYNTGATDWKYNNAYVDGSDNYRHSLWLSMMGKRLKLSKSLLSNNGVLICAIDQHEFAKLALLLEDIFPRYLGGSGRECKYFHDYISVVHNPRGQQNDNISYVHETLIYIYPARKGKFICDVAKNEVDNRGLRDSGSSSDRKDARNCFYPFIIKDGIIIDIGDVPKDNFHPTAPNVFRNDGTIEIWPIDTSGAEKKWRYGRDTVSTIYQDLFVKKTEEEYSIIFGKTMETVRTVWQDAKYNASEYGTNLLKKIFCEKTEKDLRFSYAKSLYAVKQAVSSVVSDKPNALIVDFFAGSGTTLHAVNLLNAEDGGHRRCIIVTNNEVSDKEAKEMKAKGLKPGEDEWEKLGIAHYVSWPRTVCSIEGHDLNGNPFEEYYYTSLTEEKAYSRRFNQIGFIKNAKDMKPTEKKQLIALFGKGILPQRLVNKDSKFIVSDDEKHTISVLFDDSAVEEWLEALAGMDHITDFYIVTAKKAEFNKIKERVNEILGPIIVQEQVMRPMSDGFAANCEYFKLGFLDKKCVSVGMQFREILPLLWLRAGAKGKRPEIEGEDIPEMLILPENGFAVLTEEALYSVFAKELSEKEGVETVFFVTNSDSAFREMSDGIRQNDTYQLYKDYLENFMIGARRALQ